MRNYTSDARLKERIYKEQNALFSKRLKQIKPTIITKSPEIFPHSRSQNNNRPHKIKKNICKLNIINNNFIVEQFEIKRNNMILYKKLLDIDKNRKNKISQNLAPAFNFKKKNKEILVQNQIRTLAQENLFMLKRLLERTSNINNKQLKEDFEKNQEYKQHICIYPSINFYSNKRINEPIIKSFNSNEKSRNNTNAFPTIYKMSSLQFNKMRTHKLDEQYYKHAKKSIRKSPISRTDVNKEEIKSGSGDGNDSGSGSGDDDNGNKSRNEDGSGSGDDSGSGSGSGNVSKNEDKESSIK